MGGADLACVFALEMPETLLLMHPSAPPLNEGWNIILSTLLRFQLVVFRRLGLDDLNVDHYFEAPASSPRLPLPLAWSRL